MFKNFLSSFIALAFLLPLVVRGQENDVSRSEKAAEIAEFKASCTEMLNKASDYYESGDLLKVGELLKDGEPDHLVKVKINFLEEKSCFDAKYFTKEERIRAYKLLALVNIFNDEAYDAGEAVKNLLDEDPEHPLTRNDPAELKYLMERYRIDPIYRISIGAGTNFTSTQVLKQYAAFNNYASKVGWQVGVNIEKSIPSLKEWLSRAELTGGIHLSSQSYNVSYGIVQRSDSIKFNGAPYDPDLNQFSGVVTENQLWIKVPIGLRYNFPLNKGISKFTPFVSTGLSTDILMSAKLVANRIGTQTFNLPDHDLKSFDKRQTFNLSYYLGAGVKIQSKRIHSIFMEGRYYMGMSNITVEENRYASQDFSWVAAVVDDDKVINSTFISVGYIWSIYSPKKLREKRYMKKYQSKY